MSLRFNTLLFDSPISHLYRKALFFILTFSCSFFSLAQNSGEEDIKKEANKRFEDEDYTVAYKLYSQLVSNYPKDPFYNFRLGVCMIYSEPDKKKCIPYLQFANSKPESPKETRFYLGKAYHINYLFDEALKNYNEFKKIGSSSQQKKLQVDREIKACVYGKRLLSNLSDLVVQNKKQLNEADYFRSYDLRDIGGKLLAKPDDFKSPTDKKKKDKSIVFLPKTGNRVYFSSYGEDDHRDIYYATKLPNGTFSKPQKVTGINSEFDEDYPFLHPSGTTLYFASKGHNGMGGYDIFKSTYIEATDSWSQPVNLEFPINSPDDDYLYVTDSLEKTAFFSTGRQSLPGKIDVLKISTERKPIDILAIKGTVVKENAEQSLKSKITVKNMDNGQIVGIYDAQDNGDYLMDLPNGAKLLYTVETPGLKTQSDRVALPMVATSKPLKQTISYDKGILKIINYFDENASDDSYIQYLKIIEQKAKLDVNEGKNKINPTLVKEVAGDPLKKGTGNTNSGTGPSVESEGNPTATTTATVNKGGLDNKKLSELAKKEAEDIQKEANQLQQDSYDAFDLGNQKKKEAEKKLIEADAAVKNAEAITNNDEKKAAVEKAMAIKKEAQNDLSVASKIISYAEALKEDAEMKSKEAELNRKYGEELEKSMDPKSNSKETLTKLDDLQKQIDAIADKKKKSDDVYNSIKNDLDEKEKQLTTLEKNIEDTKTNIQEIKNAIAANEAELNKTKKKKDKEIIQQKIDELTSELTEKQSQVSAKDEDIKKLKDEVADLNKGMDMANRIKNETIAVNTSTTAVSTNTNSSNVSNNPELKTTSSALADKYKEKTIVTDDSNKNNIEQSTTELKNYNKELDAAITKNKNDIAKTTNATKKQELNNELKQLEAAKKQNLQQISDNNKKLEELNKTIASNTSSVNTVNPVTATNNSEAITQLDNLNTKLNSNDNANFDYNSYQNTEAQKLKVEADSKINDAIAQQKKLKDVVEQTKEQLKQTPSSTVTPGANPAQLYKEAEDLTAKAFNLRTQANTKTGKEKEDLLAQAKIEEAKANEKNLQAAEIVKNDNKTVFDTNKENLQLLITENKATAGDITEAKKLSEEANLAFKQANAIREEANSLTNPGAKLGNLSNAEEKETEALSKQKQAVDLLKASSPNTVLKTAVTSANTASVSAQNNSSQTNLNSQLAKVNTGIDDLLKTKIDAYKKLYSANAIEIELLQNNLKNNQAEIDKAPVLKSEFLSANNKVTASQKLNQSSESATDNNIKLNDLVEATKKQIEALNQLNKLEKNIGQTLASNTSNTNTANSGNNNSGNNNSGNNTTDNNQTANNNSSNKTVNNNQNTNTSGNNNSGNNTTDNNQTANNNSGNNTVNNSQNTNTSGNNNSSNAAASNNNSGNNNNQTGSVNSASTGTTANNTNTNSVNSKANNNQGTASNTATTSGNDINNNAATSNTNSATASTNTIEVSTLAKTDTSTAQVITYLENNKTTLKNPQANAMINKSLIDLKKTEDELKIIENQIKNGSQNNSGEESPSQLKAKAENLLIEAEDLGVKAFDLKTSAKDKTGAEKEAILAKAKELETSSQNKKLEAIKLTEEANSKVYSANNNAITDLITKLKTDNPVLAEQLKEKINEVNTLKTQSSQLRNEANALTNNNAKVGSMMNAEEKEAEMLQKQNDVLNELKKQYPDYVVKSINTNTGTTTVPSDLKQKQTLLKEKENTSLTDLTNAFSLEYETSKNNIPANLNSEQKAIKQNADELNAESKRLLIKSASEKNENEKTKLLTLAAKTGNAAVDLLNKLPKTNNTVAVNNNNNNNNTGNNSGNKTVGNSNSGNNNNSTNPNNNNASNTNNTGNNSNTTAGNNPGNNAVKNNTAVNNTTGGAGTIKVEGLEVTAGNAYSNAKPIPVDEKIPDGLVFRVQIGAFKNKLPNNTFRGLSPVNGETTPNGYIRYTAGNFLKFENANAVKNDLKNLGYSDAFVVVFFNGKRIPLNEAMAILAKEGKTVDNNAPQTVGINANSNIPKATVNAANPNLNPQDIVTVTKELEKIDGLLYTVQVGVYTKQISKQKLLNLKPIYTEQLPNGLYRYTAGIYNNTDKLITDKGRVVTLGVRDAFVSAYLNGKRISFADGKLKQQESTTKLEPENPIIFPDLTSIVNNTPVITNTPVISNTPVNTTTVQPFSNGVTSYPAATAENGVKTTEEGICFKVQIGAYSKQVPADVAARFSSIRTWPVENKQINSLFIYNIGNFSDAKFAKTLKDEAVRVGITDAFITVYKDGKKLYGPDATQYLNR